MTYSGIIFTHEMLEALGVDGTKGKWREKQKGLSPQSWRIIAGEGLESGSLQSTENSRGEGNLAAVQNPSSQVGWSATPPESPPGGAQRCAAGPENLGNVRWGAMARQ